MSYTVILTHDPEYDGYTVTVPALPGCLTEGKSVDEALAMAKDAVSLYVQDLAAHGEPVPVEDRAPVVTTVEAA